MAEQEKVSAKDKALMKGKEAENKVKTKIFEIENSAVGKRLPTQIENITLADVIWMTILSDAVLSLGIYLIVDALQMQKGFRATILMVDKYILGFSTLLSFIIDGYCYFMRWGDGYLFFLILKCLKGVAMLVAMLASSFSGMITRILSIVYILSGIGLSLCLLYYMAIFLKRVESDEYDDFGQPVKGAEEKQTSKKEVVAEG
ncbi:hypothetical protein SLOPH_2267 [Spraguea lophii 42_110]|uniref:Uncharacterized protein n=1 Tax=Spraguea lophii (strain 42_110) TaxID=1358809 RepID=S7XLD2_SPRLO|nr:hypothetical protein SLOPH_2267 [Spraguea lophii 42_110]